MLWALSPGLLLGACAVLCAPSSAAGQPLAPAVAQLRIAGETNPPPSSFNFSQGRKKLLYIRVAYPDDPTEPVTEAQAYSFMNQVDQFYVDNSYNLVTFITTVTPVLTLPQPKAWYTNAVFSAFNFLNVFTDARAAATAAGYNDADYDFDIVHSVFLTGFDVGGDAYQGFFAGRGIITFAGNTGASGLARSLGFNLGLRQGDFWNTSRPLDVPTSPSLPVDPDSAIGHDDINAPGREVVDGDPFDLMGHAGSLTKGHFTTLAKAQLNWLGAQYIRDVKRSETNRVYAYDAPSLISGRTYALRLPKDSERQYWVDFRQLWTDNPWLSNGLELHWPRWSVFTTNGMSALLDATPGTAAGSNDCTVVVGRTFADNLVGFYMTPVAKGGSNLQQWIDVVVQFGPFPTNVPPVVSLTASALAVTNGGQIDFTASAQDDNGDSLAYYWDFGDQSFGSNAPVNSKVFTNDGRYVIRCEVSDMKGGLGSAYVVVTVGNPTNALAVNGQVFDEFGAPVQGVRVHNGVVGSGYRYTFTDSDGNYTLAGLAPGSYKIEAFLFGYRTVPLDYINPVQLVGADAYNLDLLAMSIPQLSITAPSPLAYPDSTNGVFTISRNGDTSQDLFVSFTIGGNADPEFDYMGLATNVVVIESGLSSVDIPIVATDPRMPVFVTLSLNPPTNATAFPSWEALLVNGQSNWFQTYPSSFLAPASATVTVLPPDSGGGGGGTPTVSIQVLDDTALETGNDSATVLFTRSGSTAQALTIHYSVSGTAINGVDYAKLPGVITIPAGETSIVVPIVAQNDFFVELTESVIITIDADDAYAIGSGSATVQIVDDDLPLVTVNVTDAIALEGSGNSGTFTVTRYGDLSGDLLVNYLVTGTASNGVDYTSLSGAVTIPAGKISTNISVSALSDSVVEGVETVTIFLSESTTYNITAPNTATVFIQEGTLPTVTLDVTTAAAVEGGATGLFTITRTGSTSNSLTVNFAVGGTAVLQSDYAAIGTNVVIPAGASNATVTISAGDDSFHENTENVILQLLPSTNYNLGSRIVGTVTISDNDPNGLPAVGFVLRTSSVLESATYAYVPVAISANPATNKSPVVMEYHITGGSAMNGSDYNLTNGFITFVHDGPMIQNIIVPISNDELIEPNETIFLTLFDPNMVDTNGVAITNNAVRGAYITHTLTILDDDLAQVSIVATNGLAYEEGQKPSAFKFTRIGSTTAPLTVNFAVSGTASSRSDYVPLGNSITIPAGTNSVLLPLIPVDDPTEEHAETVTVTILSAPGAAVGLPNSATIVIVDNDGTIQFTSPTFYVNENEGTAFIGVQRTGNTNVTSTVDFLVSNGTASNGVDYAASSGRLTFAPGESLQLVPIQIIDDTLVEPVETINLALTNATGGAPLGGQRTATVFILDDDTAFAFATNSFRANENSPNAVITINRVGLISGALNVTFWTAGGSATPESDYHGVTNTISFAPGEVTKDVLIPMIDDDIAEANETVQLYLADGSGHTNTATLTIVDDECALQFASAAYSVNEYAGSVTVVVQRTGGTVNPVSVNYQTLDGSANSVDPDNPDYFAQSGTLTFRGDSYVPATNGSGALMFQAGDTTRTITIPIVDDPLGEGNETFSVLLSEPTGPAPPLAFPTSTILGPVAATVVTIIDNETPGAVDSEFKTGLGANDRVLALALQSDGKIVFGGEFTLVNGVSLNRVGRLQSSGFLDGSFNPGLGIDAAVDALAVQGDGKLLVGGAFSKVNNTNRVRIARLNANGTLDLSFNPGSGANGVVRAIAVQADNKILIGGDFTQVGSAGHNHLARLNADGTVDTGFTPSINNTVSALAVQADGSILAGGSFTSVNGALRNSIARLSSFGGNDLGFDSGAGANGPVNGLALQSDGKILLGGSFTDFDGHAINYLARLGGSGSFDASFSPGLGPNGPVNTVAVDASGKIVIGGTFTLFDGANRGRFARLKSNGALDIIFNPGTGANAAVESLAIQPDSAVVLGGDFTQINGLPEGRIARIHGDEKASLIGVEFAAARFSASEASPSAMVTVLRTGNTNQAFSISYATSDGTASNGLDYIGATNVLNFAAGETNKSFTISILDDSLIEGDETVNLILTNGPPNVDLSGRISAVLLILDDERFIQFTGTNYVVREGDTNARITLRRTGGLSGPASVTFATADGTATAGQDYLTVLTTVNFADGESNAVVLVPIIDDTLGEPGESVLMTISSPVGATLGTRTSAALTIIDNDLVHGNFTFDNTNRITILDASPASPYPSSIGVSNLAGVVGNISVTLFGLSHTFPGDIEMLLASPSGRGVVLMSDAGGGTDAVGATLRFDDAATTYLPQAGPIVTSTNRPTDYPPSDSFYSPAPPGPYGATLGSLNGTDANGVWSLYVLDDRGSDSGVISNGWRLSFTTFDPATTNDLAMGMTDSPDPISAGGILSYSISITNNGPIPATGVVVQDTLPSTMNLAFIKFSQGSCSNLGNVVTCNLGDLAAGDTATVILKAVPTTAGTYTNSASVSASEPDLALANNQASVTTTVTPAMVADLSVTMTDAPDPVLSGQLLTYTVFVTNNGPLTATGVVLTNTLPGGANFVLANSSQGSGVVAGSVLFFNLGTLAAGSGATATIVVRPGGVGSLTNTANAAANEPDSSPENRATAVTQVSPAADLIVSLTDATDPVLTNGVITYTATILNSGPVTAHGVSLFDTLPVDLTFVSATNSQGSNVLAGGTVIFSLGTIVSGGGATATIRLRAPPTPGVVANRVVVIASEPDPVTANNSAEESTTVNSEHSSGAGIISNGTIEMGVNPAGDLNVQGNVLSSGRPVNTTYVGLRYLPTGAESTADGCLCEGWGVADTILKIAGGANESADSGSFGLTIESFQFDPTTARSVVIVQGTNSGPVFRVTHYYHPSVTINLYQVDVTIENISSDATHVLYRRVMDWDIEPTAFSEYSTMNKGTSTNLYFTSDNGFASANPLSGPSHILVTGNFVDSGPADHGALFDFDFGLVAPGDSVFFRTYYGAAGTEADANRAVARVGAEAYSYGQPNTPNGPSRGEPNTFIFAFGGIGGTLLFGADMGIGMTSTPNPVAIGDGLTYSIGITNAGPDPATGVTLTDVLPDNVTLISATTSLGSVTNSAGTVTVSLGGMVKGQVATVTVVVQPSAESFLTNLVSISANEDDGNVANNLATSVTPALALGTFANPAVITIADAVPASPYPSVIHVSGLSGVISKVTATLVEVSHTFPSDIDALLVGPGGQNVILMSDAGQGDDLNRVTLRFDDAALVSLPANSAILPGIDYKPTNFGDGDYFAPPAPTEPYGSTLSVFNGTNPNGDWLLYIMDDQGSDAGVVYGGWRLTFTTGAPVPLLTIERVANTVTLSWSATATGYTLESKDILSSPDPWDTVTSSPPVAGGRFTVNLGIAGGNKFFRLRK